MEMRVCRNILGISYKDRVTNEKVRSTIKSHIGPHEDLTTVTNRKLKWFGHVTRSSGLPKTVLQGTVEGKRKRGRQRKGWTDKAEEWTGNSGGEETERQTEERMDRQCRGMDREQWRGRGRQRKRWTDTAEKWTGKPLAETQALAHDGNRRRRLVYSMSGP